MPRIILVLLLIALVGTVAYYIFKKPSVIIDRWPFLEQYMPYQKEKMGQQTSVGTEKTTAPAKAEVLFTNGGYTPQEVTIPVGGTVTFTNDSTREVWTASNVHPTHTVYPGSDINKCGTPEAALIFDSCGVVALGQSWSFTFSSPGSWTYHNHLRASETGRVIVQE